MYHARSTDCASASHHHTTHTCIPVYNIGKQTRRDKGRNRHEQQSTSFKRTYQPISREDRELLDEHAADTGIHRMLQSTRRLVDALSRTQ